MQARGEHFPVRLERDMPRGMMAGCALAIGIVLTAIGVFPIRMTIANDPPGERLFFYIWGGAFCAVGVVMLLSGVQQLFARATPETIVEMDAPTLVRGRSVELLFRQPGPVVLKSLRANLVGEERWATWVTREGRRERRWETRHLDTINVLDHGEAEVGRLLDVFATFDVPADIEPTLHDAGPNDRSVSWKIEVWGVVRGRADFMHAFPVTVE